MLIPDLNNPLFPPIVRGIDDRLAAAGYVALIGNTDADDERERVVFEQMRARHVDGFVLATAHLRSPLLAEAARAEIPVVLMNRLAEDYSFPSVSVDNERGVRMAVEPPGRARAPPDRAHRRPAGRVHRAAAATRASSPRWPPAACRSTPAWSSSPGGYSLEEGAAVLPRAAAGLPAPAARPSPPATTCSRVGCYAALDAAGLTCPEDMSVVGFNDMPFIDRLRPPLTTVRFPHYQVGTEAGAAAAGADRRAQRARSKILYLAPELIVRGSTASVEPGPDRAAGQPRLALGSSAAGSAG